MKKDTLFCWIVTAVFAFVAIVNTNLWMAAVAGAIWGGWFDRVITWAEQSLRVKVPRRLERGW